MNNKIKIISLILILLLIGCGSTSPAYSTDTYYTSDHKSETVAEKEYNTEYSLDENIDYERKITKEYFLNMDTKNIDVFLVELDELIDSYKGYIQYSNESLGDSSYRYSNLSIKIPSNNVEEFINKISELGDVRSKSLNTNDITNTYNRTEATLTSLKIQEQRLLEIMEEATTVADIITIENQLTLVRSDIQYYDQLMEDYKNQISYSLVEINIYENKEGTIVVEENFFDKLKNEFVNAISNLIYFVQGLILMIVSIWPFIIIIIVLISVLKPIIKKRKLKKQEKLDENKKL